MHLLGPPEFESFLESWPCSLPFHSLSSKQRSHLGHSCYGLSLSLSFSPSPLQRPWRFSRVRRCLSLAHASWALLQAHPHRLLLTLLQPSAGQRQKHHHRSQNPQFFAFLQLTTG